MIDGKNFLLRLLTLFLLIVPVTGCSLQPGIPVGFSAALTGKQNEQGVNLRNGVELAVEEINAAGGVNGRILELRVEDDLGTEEGARQAERRLIGAGVVAILGHMTSSQTLAGDPEAEAGGIPLLSATASTSLMTGKRDLFLRTVVSTDDMGRGFASYIRQERGLKRLAIILDQDNTAYSTPMAQTFQDTFTRLGGEISAQLPFSARQSPDFFPLVEQLMEDQPEGVLIIASPADTALIAQAINLKNWKPALFTSSWGQGASLIQNGGSAVEDMETIIAFDMNDSSPALQAFKDRYEKRFGQAPNFIAAEGFETMKMLAVALQANRGKSQGLAQALINLNDFQGLTGLIRLDEYGDAIRPLYIQKIGERRFQTIHRTEPLP